MKLSEIKGEKAIEIMADLLDPIAEIVGDKEIEKAYNEKVTYLEIAKIAIKRHTRAITTILALLDGQNPETYEVSLLSLPKKVVEILEDEELKDLFQLQARKTVDAFSTPAYPTTTE